ncbi:MAG: uroporphyrinogen III methyltransferase [bacterium]|nr:MAG: uroporphyrinogen III methyltransferase [bacterium]
MTLPHRSKLFFVGTGPGAIGLVTKRAFWALKKADIVIYGRFINPNLLFYASKKARYISACNDEEAIFSELSKLDGSRNTVWLTIGDPIFFSKHNRRMEKFAKLANLEIEIIPGVTSALAASTYSGILVSKPDCTDTVTISVGKKVATGKTNCPKKSDSPTVIFFLALDCLRELTEELFKAGWHKSDACAIIENGTTQNRTVFGGLSEIADMADSNGISEPALFVCGQEASSKNRFGWFEKKPLFSKKIVVTRPMPEGLDTVDKLEELGADVLYLPVVNIVRLPCDIDSTDYDLVIFTSAKSVSCFFDNIKQSGIHAGRIGSIACVGKKTAAALSDYHLKADIIPDDFSAKALTDKLIIEEIEGKRILIPGSEMMNPAMSLRLREAGASVKLLYLYRPEKNPIQWSSLIEKKIENWGNIDYLMLTSGFIAKAAADFFENKRFLVEKSSKTVAISKNVGRISKRLGFKNIIVSDEAAEESMIKKILDDIR